MLTSLFKKLTHSNETPLSTSDTSLALAVLMVRIARSDDDYDSVEIDQIDTVLSQHFKLSATDAKQIRTQAEELEHDAPDTVRFTRTIKDGVAFEDRVGIVKALWSVVLADGTRDDNEDGFMRLVANLLGVNDRDSAFARQEAQAAQS